MGSERFAKETGQKLHTFYSHDKFVGETEEGEVKRWRSKVINPARATNIVSEELQTVLWNIEPHLTGHRAGRLSICIGMPVMIKHNEATECCVINGAEDTVVGWTARPLSNTFSGNERLEMLFVKLICPPKSTWFEMGHNGKND